MNTDMKFSVEDEIKDVTFKRPHVVLLGAGASRAAFQKGDKNGRKLPVMKDFVDVLGLDELLCNASVKPPYDDFEGDGQNLVYIDGHVEWVASQTAGWTDAAGNRDNVYVDNIAVTGGTDSYILQDGT